MLDAIEDRRLTLEKVVLTHAHLDHIAGLHHVRHRHPDVPILIHAEEELFLTDTRLNLSAMFMKPVVAPEATGLLHDGDTLELGGLRFDVIHTPGHSPGGITLHQPDQGIAIVGDTLLAGSIGRNDFPTSDGAQLMKSITDRILGLPDGTRLLPGHGPETTVGRERATNPFLNEPAGRSDGLVG